MTARHTPGPWHVQPSDHPGGLLIKPIPGQVVAQCDEVPEMEANASLIAAAPETAAERDRLKAINAEMLEALKALHDRVRQHTSKHNPFDWQSGSDDRAMMEAAVAAIAKAEAHE